MPIHRLVGAGFSSGPQLPVQSGEGEIALAQPNLEDVLAHPLEVEPGVEVAKG